MSPMSPGHLSPMCPGQSVTHVPSCTPNALERSFRSTWFFTRTRASARACAGFGRAALALPERPAGLPEPPEPPAILSRAEAPASFATTA